MPSPHQGVLVFGEALVDVFADGEVLGGAPFNVARNLAAFGLEPLMLTRVGRDSRGDAIANAFADNGMDARGLQRDRDRATGAVIVHEGVDGPCFDIQADAAWDFLEADELSADIQGMAPAVAYFGTLAQRSEQSRMAIRQALETTGAKRFLDLNLRGIADEQSIAMQSLGLADILKVNEAELVLLLQWAGHGAEAEDAAIEALMLRHDLQRVVVTRGALGWSCHDRHSDVVLRGDAVPVDVCDTVGAGDAFSSVLILGELRGWSLAETLQKAAAFAAAVCGVRGGFIGAPECARLS